LKIGIIDYQMGNLASLKNSFDFIGVSVDVIKDANDIRRYDKLILPGVGAFEVASNHLRESGFDVEIREFVKSGKYLFGICLGMQMLFSSSEEGKGEGLGFFEEEIVRFSNNSLKVPHMGWNLVKNINNSKIFNGLEDSFYLYFVHSYYAKLNSFAVGVTDYGVEFMSAVEKDNIIGLQPHPEKSHKIGLKILQNFVELR